MYKLFFLGIILIMCQCKSSGPKEDIPYPATSITFGRGGGFTGMTKSYTLYEGGSLYLDDASNRHEETLFQINKNQSKQLFQIYDQMNFLDYDIQLPGNYYNFVTYSNSNKKHKIIWTDDRDVPKEMVIFFEMLNKLVQD